jgi:hypothetical protein
MVKEITIYVEGGGNDNQRLAKECRRGFSEFFKKLGIRTKIVACGGRDNAHHRFCVGLKRNEDCFLLVDSEQPVKNNIDVWQYVKLRDNWEKPNKATDEHLHFMVECMEAWFMADKDTLARYYGKNFNQNALPKRADIENIFKSELEATLEKATRYTTKGEYDKGKHSFDILSKIDATKVIDNSFYAQRLRDTLKAQSKLPY